MRKKPASSAKQAKLTVSPEPAAGLDSFDLGILAALKENARMPNVQIADRIGLSEAPCSRRIRRLEQEGVIRKYTVELEPSAIGVSFVGYVTLVLDYVTGSTAQEFVDAIAEIPEVMSCYIVSGAYDAILHVAAKDSGSYSDIVFDKLRRIPGVKDVRSSFVMRTIKAHTGLPLLPET